MIKFMLAARPRPDGDPAMFDYEWGVIHPSLMLTTESVVRTFLRYAQHRAVEGATGTDVRIPFAPEGWSCMSDHWLEGFDKLGDIFTADYMRRMHPHNFGDSAFVIELVEGHVVRDAPGRVGGVKTVAFLTQREGVGDDEFRSRLLGDVAQRTVAADRDSLIAKYVINTRSAIDPALFAGTLFEQGGCGQYAAVEEMWFDDLEAARRFAGDRYSDAHAALAEVADLDASFSMLLVERVLWDRTVPGAPTPAIFDPDSFESRVVATERPADRWRTPEPARVEAVA